MIAPLRRRHRLAWILVSVSLPILLVAALAGRSPAAQQSPELESPNRASSFTTLSADLRRQGNRLELQLRQPLRSPDVLAYVSSEVSGTSLPPDAVLLGTVRAGSTNRYFLPTGAPDSALWLYSLAHQEVLDIATLKEPQP